MKRNRGARYDAYHKGLILQRDHVRTVVTL